MCCRPTYCVYIALRIMEGDSHGVGDRDLLGDWRLQNPRTARQLKSCRKAGVDDNRAQSVGACDCFHFARAPLAIRWGQAMTFLLGGIGIVICIALASTGYLLPLIVGGIAGSFFGLAGFGGAISGMIPGAIVGALVAIALK